MRIGGIVLCGGQSKRMGTPKAWLTIGGELMLPRVARLLQQAVSPIVVVAAVGQDLPPLPRDIAVVRDGEPERGPLQGLAAGLAALEGLTEAAYVTSCDVPFLRPAFIRRMIELLGANHICVPHVGNYHHPLAALYRLDVLGAVKALLQANQLRLIYLFDKAPTRIVEAHELADIDPDFATLRNLNTPEAYEQALRDAESV